VRVVLLRVGIDTGSGGWHSPLFDDGSFELLPIPASESCEPFTYGTYCGRNGRPILEYLPRRLHNRLSNKRLHLDPEFSSFTYGDPTQPKARLRTLTKDDILVFYAGLQRITSTEPPALYIVGYFNVEFSGIAGKLQKEKIDACKNNFHVRHATIFNDQVQRLVLVKGGEGSRMLGRAIRISVDGENINGTRLHRLSPEMRAIFGDFGRNSGEFGPSIERSNPCWVGDDYIERAKRFVVSMT